VESPLKYVESVQQFILNLLVRVVCWRVSDLVVFNLAYFCVGLDGGVEDARFRAALDRELSRRGILDTSDFTTDNVIVDKFTEDDLDSAALWFDSAPDEPTSEDSYTKVILGHNHFAEQAAKIICTDCIKDEQEIGNLDTYFVQDNEPYHPDCYAVGDSFDDLEGRTRWLLELVTDTFHTFLTEYPQEAVPVLSAGFMPDLERDLGLLLAEVAKIREQAAKLTPEEVADLFRPITSNGQLTEHE
jgi:hypothetical protein